MENFPMGNLGRFSQGKSAVTELRYPTLINYKVHAGSFHVSIIHQTLTWTTWSWRTHMIMLTRVYTHKGWAHWKRDSTTFLTKKNPHKLFLCSWRRWGSNLGSLGLESDALPTEPPHHLVYMCSHTCTCTLHRMRELRAQPCSITTPCRQPHSIFGGFLSPFLENEVYVRSLPWLQRIPTQQNITFYCSFSSAF